MKSNISCAIIKDLMPTYLDELTSEETNKVIEGHIAECEECTKLLKDMREPEIDHDEMNNEKIEIDFLKKNKKQSKLILGSAVIIAVISIIAGSIIPLFTKYELSYEEINLDLSVGDITIDDEFVEDGLLSLTAKAYGPYGISNIDCSEKDGVVTIKVIGARDRIWTSSVYGTQYNTKNTIKAIRFGNNIIWENGVTVFDDTLEIYKTAHPYVGDISKNGETLHALKIFEILGEYTIQLHTSEEPYGMTVEIRKPIEAKKEAYLEKYMGYAAYNCLAVIDNLSYVSFQYESGGVQKEAKWDLEKAQQTFGKSIKDYGKSEVSLASLKWDYYAN